MTCWCISGDMTFMRTIMTLNTFKTWTGMGLKTVVFNVLAAFMPWWPPPSLLKKSYGGKANLPNLPSFKAECNPCFFVQACPQYCSHSDWFMQKMKNRRLFVPICMVRGRWGGRGRAEGWTYDHFLWRCSHNTLILTNVCDCAQSWAWVQSISKGWTGTMKHSCVLWEPGQ